MSESLEELAGKLGPTHQRLVKHLGDRWIKGTGFCHRSVGTDLIALGIADSRAKRNEREIRATPLGFALRQHLLSQGAA